MAETIALTGASVFTGDEIITGKNVLIRDGIITGLPDDNSLPDATDIVDCSGSYISPGFIDLQIAGAGGYLFSSHIYSEALSVISKSILRTGTTSFLLVLPTNTFDIYHSAFDLIKLNPHPAVLGLHLEGPYISHEKKGAHVPELIRKASHGELETLLKSGEGEIKMMTLAPETCDPGFIGLLNESGIVACAGHSNATFREASSGFSNGIKAVTHLFNAMSPLHHREPGLPGATLLSEGIMSSIVADGIHVDYNTVSIAKRIMKERLYLISDAVEENREGVYQHIRRNDRYILEDGTLSGSALTMMTAVKNCVEKAGISLEESLRMASLYPAKLMNLTDRGRIAKGYQADLVVFDANFSVKQVIKKGIRI